MVFYTQQDQEIGYAYTQRRGGHTYHRRQQVGHTVARIKLWNRRTTLNQSSVYLVLLESTVQNRKTTFKQFSTVLDVVTKQQVLLESY